MSRQSTYQVIYEIVKQIPKGRVATYGQVAVLAGNRKWSRVVGNALHANPNPMEIPCHRIVNAKGELSKAYAFGGMQAQEIRLLEEGVAVADGKVDLKRFLWKREELLLQSVIRRWKLTEVKVIYENRYKAVYAAVSEEYGAVILKWNRDKQQLREEYEMLHKLSGNGCCKVFAYDAEMGSILEERLIPGTVLREEEDLAKRVEVFVSIFHRIHYAVDCDTEEQNDNPYLGVQSYMDWLENAYHFCVRNDINKELTEKTKLARDICAEMFTKYPERMMLHGDLHHDNILQKSDGTYAMIDPKGVIGPEILEVARFIMNEIDTKYTTSAENHMYEVVQCVSKTLGFPSEDVVKVYFMEVILGNVWCIEDGEEVNVEEMELATRILHTTCQQIIAVLKPVY